MADDIATVCVFDVALPSLEDTPSACIGNVGASTAHHSVKELASISAISNVLLKTGQSVIQLQDDAAKTFFPQPSRFPNADIYRKTQPVTDEGLQAPFSLFELEQALSSINARSAPGHDGVTWAALRNLEEYAKKQLLDEINAVWVNAPVIRNRSASPSAVPTPQLEIGLIAAARACVAGNAALDVVRILSATDWLADYRSGGAFAKQEGGRDRIGED
ncbi:hypothetical protein HPB49_021890 [Dermacentor silvarum]|uniref:Uncharacterized protein n=1 Tax=Dermacentor silvarum TaxID=543639 RepID=A0ACB8CHN2_DERSI|nr:hypothetical protein HPB49_021890 [Dermacentor silvarum]